MGKSEIKEHTWNAIDLSCLIVFVPRVGTARRDILHCASSIQPRTSEHYDTAPCTTRLHVLSTCKVALQGQFPDWSDLLAWEGFLKLGPYHWCRESFKVLGHLDRHGKCMQSALSEMSDWRANFLRRSVSLAQNCDCIMLGNGSENRPYSLHKEPIT